MVIDVNASSLVVAPHAFHFGPPHDFGYKWEDYQ